MADSDVKKRLLDQTAATLSTTGEVSTDLRISPADRQVLRRLASQVAELAARPIEHEKRRLWYKLNALEPTRPVVFCDPENGWNEIVTLDQLECEGDLALRWEMTLRKEIFWGAEMCDDRVVLPSFVVPHVYTESDWGMHEQKIGGHDGGSYTWEAPLKSFDDLDKLHTPVIQVDEEATARVVELAEETLGDLLEVRLQTAWWWTLGMTWTLINLRGLTNFMYDLVDSPDQVHQLLTILRDGHLAKLDYLEENGLLSLNNDGTYVGSGGFGWSHELPQPGFDGKVRTIDMWGFGESQETIGVSPKMFAEYILPYQIPILERFGLNCYGCCEPVDKRWEYIKDIPRLRRVSVSPWANIPDLADMMEDRFIMSIKPSPTPLAVGHFDEDEVRKQLREALEPTRDCRVEVIMKDNHTIGNDPQRVVRWVEIAREEAVRL
jgi:hypothetical protein